MELKLDEAFIFILGQEIRRRFIAKLASKRALIKTGSKKVTGWLQMACLSKIYTMETKYLIFVSSFYDLFLLYAR